jgi:hypothetical protein
LSEWALITLREFADFQAEYEGSIPFTRSNNYNALCGVNSNIQPCAGVLQGAL